MYDFGMKKYEQAPEETPDRAKSCYAIAAAWLSRALPQIEGLPHHEREEMDFPLEYSRVGECYHKAGYIKSAIGAYEKSIELDPDFSDAWSGLGAVHISAWDYSKGFEALKTARDLEKLFTSQPHEVYNDDILAA